jgi:NAD(P)-dependent dehydrogenase (short-subunit alcohol dehydrogenase family)
MDLTTAKHAFITGGASGLGLGIADALAARGIGVTIADLDGEAIDAVVAARGGTLRGQVLDVRDRAAWASAKTEAEAALGPVDILVNNAGIAPDGREFADMDPASFDRIVGINLFGVFNGVSAFAADFRARGRGHIVNTSSMAGLSSPFPGLGAYAVSKFGVVALSEGLRKEMAPHGVGVSVLCPGFVTTNLAETTLKAGGVIRDSGRVMPQSAVTSADVGAMVLGGIERDLLYILSHADRWEDVEKRQDAIRDAFLAAQAETAR